MTSPPGPSSPPPPPGPGRDYLDEGDLLDAIADAIAAAAPELTDEQHTTLRRIFAGADRMRGAA